MTTYIMLGKFSSGAVNEISAERTRESMAIVDFPSLEQAMKASVELTRLLGISFTTSPAITVEEFDKLIK